VKRVFHPLTLTSYESYRRMPLGAAAAWLASPLYGSVSKWLGRLESHDVRRYESYRRYTFFTFFRQLACAVSSFIHSLFFFPAFLFDFEAQEYDVRPEMAIHIPFTPVQQILQP